MDIEMARLLCLKAAWMMDKGDPRAAAPWISQIKVVAPQVALKVTDEAVQMFGGQGRFAGHTPRPRLDRIADAAPGRRSGCRSSHAGRTYGTAQIHPGARVT